MKFLTTAIAIVILIGATAALAQQPGMPGAHQPPAASAPKAGEAMPMEMCQAMMGGGMMGPSAMAGAHMAQMMEMRGEMMKAMGDIMIRHGQKMQGPRP